MRKEVKWFANEMEKVLKRNDHKGGWEHESMSHLISRLVEEIDELDHSIPLNEHLLSPRALDVIIKECCGVANFAMMIADNAKRMKGES